MKTTIAILILVFATSVNAGYLWSDAVAEDPRPEVIKLP